METTSILIKDLDLIKEALEILIEEMENYHEEEDKPFLEKLIELYERL